MGLLGFDAKEGLKDLSSKLKNPFSKEFTPVLDMKGALERDDFTDGFQIVEWVRGSERKHDMIKLKGTFMPHVPFTFGGEQRIAKDYYPGNSEPTVHVLGSRETNITIKGRFYSKRFKYDKPRSAFQESQIKAKSESIRAVAVEMQELVDAMRIRGNVVKISMGGFQRFGIIEKTNFNLKTNADIGYEITFTIVGFNPPINSKIVKGYKAIPIDINNTLIDEALAMQEGLADIPAAMPRSFATQIKDEINTLAVEINKVTDFVDTTLGEVDDIKAAIARGLGLIQNARNQATQYQIRVGALDPYGDLGTQAGYTIGGSYQNAKYLKDSSSSVFSLVALMESMREQLAEIAATEPMARHRVVDSDNLQRIAVKYYQDADQWKEIYDHNKLLSTVLERGSILEIPRL